MHVSLRSLRISSLILFVLGWAMICTVWGHDVFLRPASYELKPGTETDIVIFDGSFPESIYSLTTSSVNRLEVSDPSGVRYADIGSLESIKKQSPLWKLTKKRTSALGGADLSLSSSFKYKSDLKGSHVLGLTLREFRVAIELEDFLDYLEKEVALEWDMSKFGFTDPKDIIRERYTKTAKTVINVGSPSMHATRPMGLLVEIVPQTHPLLTKVGEDIQFQLLEEGEPLVGQSIIIGHKDDKGLRIVLSSNNEGMVTLPITRTGVWWTKFIHIEPAPEDDPMDFVSRWASLTFEVLSF